MGRFQWRSDARHDASTLGGTGGPVVDLEEGRVLGVSFGGHYLKANYAAPAWS